MTKKLNHELNVKNDELQSHHFKFINIIQMF